MDVLLDVQVCFADKSNFDGMAFYKWCALQCCSWSQGELLLADVMWWWGLCSRWRFALTFTSKKRKSPLQNAETRFRQNPLTGKIVGRKGLSFDEQKLLVPSKEDRGAPRLWWIKVTSYCNVVKVVSGGFGAAASLRRASSHYHFLLYQQFSATTAQFILKLQSKVAKLLFLSLREKDSASDFWDILPGAIKTFTILTNN